MLDIYSKLLNQNSNKYYQTYQKILILLICPTIILFASISITSCGKQKIDEKPLIKLQVEPIPNVYIQYESRSNMFWIGNELIERRVLINPEKKLVYTAAFINKLSGRNYIKSISEEVSFRANGVKLSGLTRDFQFVDYESGGLGGVQTLEINFRVIQKEIGVLKVKLVYEVFSKMPLIRKWIEIENLGGSSVKIDSIQMESLNLVPGSGYVEIYDHDSLSPIMFNSQLIEGFRVGNETPGVMKHIILDSIGGNISIGMKNHVQKYAPEIQLLPQEKFISPAVFIIFFKGELSQSKEILEEFISQYLFIKTSTYWLWYENIGDGLTESEAGDKIQLAKKAGADVFCLAGKWMNNRGDWIVKENLNISEIKNQVQSMNMKFGLSMDLAIVDLDSQILVDHPIWASKSKDGSDYLPSDVMGGKMMCLASEYAMYMAYEIDEIVKELDLDYIMLTGAIIPDDGCYSQSHLHRSKGESLWYIYEGLFAICKYLHAKHPNLIIQVSPESYNPEGKIDYALLRHTDMEWQF